MHICKYVYICICVYAAVGWYQLRHAFAHDCGRSPNSAANMPRGLGMIIEAATESSVKMPFGTGQ